MDLNLSRIFVKVAEQGSFSRAAELLRVPKSTVSKAVSRLEEITGTKLILRTTRSLTLTLAGQAYFESCLSPLQQLEEAQKALQGEDQKIQGLVKITAPEDLGAFVIAPALAELSRSTPKLRFDLDYTDEVRDLVKSGVDLAVRIGKVSESRFKVKRAGTIYLVAVAAPTYLRTAPPIKHPKDFHDQHCLMIRASRTSQWSHAGGERVNFTLSPKVLSNQMTSLLKMALAGGGIAFVPHYLCQEELQNGRLVRVLPAWTGTSFPVSLVAPLGSSSSARLKLTIEALQKALGEYLIRPK